MILWNTNIAFMIAGAISLLMLIALVFVAFIPVIDRWSRRFFLLLYSLLLMSMAASIVDMLLYSNPDYVLAEKTAIFFEFLLFSEMALLMTTYMLHCCQEGWRESPVFRTVAALWCIYFIMLLTAQFTTIFYYITPETLFYMGPLYFLLLAPLSGIEIINITALVQKRSKLSKKYFIAFLIYILISLICASLQLVTSQILITDIGAAICSFIMFLIILSDQVDQYMLQQRELAQKNLDIKILQMRPHFIYNTMMSIYYLCEQDPAKAQQVTLDFTTYLRKIFSALASEKLILFSEELEHVRAYLAVEQAQFDDWLFVEYDISHTNFRIPPLTLQPIVENAVKHGMDPDSDPLQILIQSRKTDTGSIIIVEDSGPGFNPEEGFKPYATLSNIQHRLKIMCHGEISISSHKNCGTVVKITIPDLD